MSVCCQHHSCISGEECPELAERDELISALEAFAVFGEAMRQLGGTNPKKGEWYTIHSSASGAVSLTVEMFDAAIAAIAKAVKP